MAGTTRVDAAEPESYAFPAWAVWPATASVLALE